MRKMPRRAWAQRLGGVPQVPRKTPRPLKRTDPSRSRRRRRGGRVASPDRCGAGPCPNCASEATFTTGRPAVGICRHCRTEWPAPGPAEGGVAGRSLRLFLSYAHSDHEEDAFEIKTELEERGHKVWFDRDCIRAGDDWAHCIETGLEWCEKVIVLLTPRSTRRGEAAEPGLGRSFVLNEIAKAVELHKRLVPVLLVTLELGVPIEIIHLHYVDLRECVPIDRAGRSYRKQVPSLLDAIEEDRDPVYEGPDRLRVNLQPLSFASEIADHVRRFQGRKWLLDDLKRWLGSRKGTRVRWVSGGPGTGKSALAAYVVSSWDEVCACHLCDWERKDTLSARRAVTSIAWQLASGLPAYARAIQAINLEAQSLDDPLTLFRNLIADPLV